MNKNDIIRMAEESGLKFLYEPNWMYEEQLERFAKLVAAAEREACAKVLDQMANVMGTDKKHSELVEWVRSKAEDIRARGQE